MQDAELGPTETETELIQELIDATTIIVPALALATILGLLGMAVNATRILRSLRHGVLQKGWKYIAVAAFCLVYGILALDLSVSALFPSGILKGILGYSGAAFQAIGAISLAYGCKSQYDAWSPKGMKEALASVTKGTESNSN